MGDLTENEKQKLRQCRQTAFLISERFGTEQKNEGTNSTCGGVCRRLVMSEATFIPLGVALPVLM